MTIKKNNVIIYLGEIMIINKLKELNLKKMEAFFDLDLEIKKLLYANIPKNDYDTNENTRFNYAYKLEKIIDTIEISFCKIIKWFKLDSSLIDYFHKYFKTLKEKLVATNYDYDKLVKFYQTYFSNLNPNFVTDVKSKLFGYYIYADKNLLILIQEAASINEILHAIHFYITNNYEIYEKMPVTLKGKIISDEPISLYGNNNGIEKNIFYTLKDIEKIGITDILALKDRILLLIRDCGHALQIEITKENNLYFVNYFFPKICNIDMCNQLEGLDKRINKDSLYVSGQFCCNENELISKLSSFIEKVPNDSDLPIMKL